MISRFRVGKPRLDWGTSIALCERLKKNARSHPSRFKHHDIVKSADGFFGEVIHVEWIRYDAEMGKDIWLIYVRHINKIRSFTDEGQLSRYTPTEHETIRLNHSLYASRN